jgi:type I restriction enzyme S subunit
MKMKGAAGQLRVPPEFLEGLNFPLPPAHEQGRIVDEIEKQFTRLEAGVVALKRVQANLKRYRAAVLKAAVEGRLVPTEAELARGEGRSYEPASELLARMVTQPLLAVSKKAQAGVPVPPKPKHKEPVASDRAGVRELPEGWVWATLNQLTSLITSGSRGWAEYYSDSGPLFIRAQDIKTDRLELCSVAHVRLPARIEGARTLVSRRDLLVTITGANVTKTAIVHESLGEAYVSQHVALVRPVDSSLSEYIYYWIVCSSYGRRELERVAYGAGKPGLNLDNLRELMVAVPPLPEQSRIVAEVERRLSVIDEMEMQVEANLKRAERLRQAILKRAFEGKLVPQDPNDEPASMLLERIKDAKGTGKSACATGDTATPGCAGASGIATLDRAGKRSKSKKTQAGVPVSQE